MLTETEQKELNSLRHDSQVMKDEIAMCLTEIDTENYAIRNLDEWKKGRSVGFILMAFVTLISFVIEFFYIFTNFNSMGNRLENLASAIEYSVSSTVLSVFTLILLASGIFTIFLGFRLMLEVGSSKSSRKMAESMCVKNYYNFVEDHMKKRDRLKQKHAALKIRKEENDLKISELEQNETPWNQW